MYVYNVHCVCYVSMHYACIRCVCIIMCALCIMYVYIHYCVCIMYYMCICIHCMYTDIICIHISIKLYTRLSEKHSCGPVIHFPGETRSNRKCHRQHTFPESYARDKMQRKSLCSPTLMWKVVASWVQKQGSKLSPTRGRKKRRIALLQAFIWNCYVWGSVCSKAETAGVALHESTFNSAHSNLLHNYLSWMKPSWIWIKVWRTVT